MTDTTALERRLTKIEREVATQKAQIAELKRDLENAGAQIRTLLGRVR